MGRLDAPPARSPWGERGNLGNWLLARISSDIVQLFFFFPLLYQDVERHRLGDLSVRLSHATQTMDTNPIKTAITVCSELIHKQVRDGRIPPLLCHWNRKGGGTN